MNDADKTKEQLIQELDGLRRQVAESQESDKERRRAEAELLESEGRLRAILESIQAGVLIIDPQTHTIADANPAAAKLIGAPKEQIVGSVCHKYVCPADKGKCPITDLGQRVDNSERVLLTADGTSHPIIKTVSTVMLAGRPHLLEGFVSVTERKLAEAERERLLTEQQKRTTQLQTAAEVSHAASSILDLDELLPKVVELVRERFGLYYAGLFLVDETGRWAVLRAGTGEAGKKMIEAGHRLEVGGASMIGACIGDAKARIALDVGTESLRFENPLLPLTRSEMALPLTSRGHVIGAVTIQSDRPTAFTQEDITVLQTMADQVANAIENARLFNETQQRNAELTTLNEIISSASQSLELRTVLDVVLKQTMQVIGFDGGLITMYNETRKKLERIVRIGLPGGIPDDPAEGLEDSLCGVVFIARDAVVIQDFRQGAPIDVSGYIEAGYYSYIGVPLEFKGRILGTLCGFCKRAGSFGESATALLRTVGRQIGFAIENARLFEQAHSRAEELAALNEMSRALSAVLTMDTAIESIYRCASRLMDTTNFYVALYDSQQDEVSFPLYAEGEHVRPLAGRRRTGQGMTEYVIRSREPLLVAENVSARIKELGIEPIGQESQSWLGVPMMLGERVIGVLAVQSYTTPRLYNDHHRDLLSAVAGQAAIAIENSRLFEQVHARAEEMAALNELSRALAAHLTVSQVLEEVYRGVSRLLDTANFYIGLYNPERNEVSFPIDISESARDRSISVMPADRGLTGYIIRSRASVLIREDVAGWLAGKGIELEGEPAQCWLGVPLMVGDQMLGVMAIQSFTTPNLYDEHDRDLLVAIASQAAISIQNARQFEQAQARAHHERILREILSTISESPNLVASLREIEQRLHEMVPLDALAMTLYTPGEPEYAIFALRSDQGDFVRQSARMPVKGTSSGWVITCGKPRLDADLGREQIFMEDEALASEGMASRLILPLKVGDQVVGTLNLASAQPGIYTEEHVSILSPVTEQMALALDRARLLEETRAALAEVEATQRRYLREKWESFLATGVPTGYMDGPDGLVPVDSALPAEPVTGGEVLSVPLKLRGEPIGVLEFYSEGATRAWSNEERAFVEALADQAALALENARLLDETQSRAQREQLINEITARIRASMDVETILHTTTQELSKALNLSIARIRLSAGDGDGVAK